MPLTLGDVLILFKGDTSHVDRALDRTEHQVSSWGQRVSGSLKRILEIATGDLLARGLNSLAGMANGTLRQGFELVKNYELQVQSLQSLAARELLNSGAAKNMTDALALARVEGEKNIKWVEQLAIKSPFSSDDIIGAYQMGAAMGVSGDNLKVLIQDTVDWAAASGKSRDAMNDVFLAFGQINTAGKTTYEDLMQLMTRGIPVWDYLSKAMGKPIPVIQKMVSQGLIPASQSIKAISDGLHGDFGGAAERMANSLAGLSGSLKDLASITLRNLMQPALVTIQPYLAKMVETLGDPAIQESIKKIGEAVGRFMVAGFDRLAKMIPVVQSFIVRVVSGFQTLRALFALVAGPWQQGADRILAIVRGVFTVLPTIFTNARNRAREWGYSTIEQYVVGIRAAITLVVSAIKAIGSVLTFWLKPNSPPKVAPNIDKWGEQTGEQYGIGIGRANVGKQVASFGARLSDQLQAEFAGLSSEDLGLVEQLSSTIGGVIDGMAKTGAIGEKAVAPLTKGLQKPLADAIRELKQTGSVSEETFAKLRKAAGPAGPVVERVTKAYFELHQATKKVVKAQAELNDVEKRYQELTRPVDAALDAIGRQRQLIADQRRMAELQTIMHDGEADAAEKQDAALEVQAIQLNAQKRALEAQQRAETDVAQQKLDAATKEQQEAEEKVKREESTLKLYEQQADLTKQMIAAQKEAAGQMAGSLNLVRDSVNDVKTAVENAKDKAESFAEQIKKTGDDAVRKARQFRDSAVAAWNKFAANPLVAGLIKLGTTIATFIQRDWKPLLGAVIGGAAAWAAPGLFVPALGFVRILKLVGGALTGSGGLLGLLKMLGGGLLSLFSPFNLVIGLGMLLGAAWGANFANIRRLAPELQKLGDLLGRAFKALLSGDIKGALKFLGPMMEQLVVLRGKVFAWLQEAVPLLIEKLKPWARAFGAWVIDSALPWLGQQLAALGTWLLGRIATNGPPILAKLGQWGKLFGDWVITTALPWLGQKLGELWTWLLGWIEQNGPSILAQLGTWAQHFGNWVTETALPWLGEKAGELIAWLWQWIRDNGPGIAEKLLLWADMFGDWVIQTALPWLGEQIAKLGEWLLNWISENGPGILKKLGEWAVKFAEWVPIGLGLLIVALGVLLGKFLGWVIENAPKLLETLGTWSEQFSNWIDRVINWLVGEGLPMFAAWIRDDLGPAILSGLGEMFGIIGAAIGELWNNAWAPGTLGDQLVTNIKKAFTDNWEAITSFIGEKAKSLMAMFDPRNWFSGQQPASAMSNGNGTPTATGTTPKFARGVRNYAGGYAWVGEDGPELVKLPRGSDVIPTPAVAGTLQKVGVGGTAQAHLHLTIQNPVVDSHERLAALVEQIRNVVSADLAQLVNQITMDTL